MPAKKNDTRKIPINKGSPETIPVKVELHPRNRFRVRYDYRRLIESCSKLATFVAPNPHGDESIDFANPDAVKALNQALLKDTYDLSWDIPRGYLCPPIPGRSDYIHYAADLLAFGDTTAIPRGRSVLVLDVGVGANCIYPLLGACEYGWRFIASEIDPIALGWASKLASSNARVADLIECRGQTSSMHCFKGVIKPGEYFDLSMCNPPFHASAAEAKSGTQRKIYNLGGRSASPTVLNFSGKNGELWCHGGELAFTRRMISQSADLSHRCLWFTTLVSKSTHLPLLYQALREAKAITVKTIEMAQGQKISRILAWSFLTTPEQRAWRQR